MKWKQTLTEVGLTEETISHGLRKKIKDYYEVAEGVQSVKEALQDPELDDEERSELQNDLEELNEGLEESDNQLVKAILIYDKNKDKYAEMSKHLGKGRPKKNPAPQDNNPKPATPPTPNTPPKVEEPSGNGEEKKKSGLGFVLVAIAVGVITLGAVNIFKNND